MRGTDIVPRPRAVEAFHATLYTSFVILRALDKHTGREHDCTAHGYRASYVNALAVALSLIVVWRGVWRNKTCHPTARRRSRPSRSGRTRWRSGGSLGSRLRRAAPRPWCADPADPAEKPHADHLLPIINSPP